MKSKFGISLLLLTASMNVLAGTYLAQDSKITKVGNIDQNQDKFFVNVAAGQVTCPVITFTVAASPSQKAFDRAFMLAVSAQLTGKRVTIFTPDVGCTSAANYIEIYD